MKMLLVTLAFAMLLSATFAAPPKTPANRVVMLLRDGSSIGGELVEATPVGVTIRPSPKSPPITRPWSAIKALGNGMTRASIVAQWRETQKELLCDVCTGAGATTCPRCGGKAIDPASAIPCATCDGTGVTGACKTPQCVDGKIACPNTCLKPTDFRGPPDKEGKRWMRFPAKGGGVASSSEAHVGQLIVMQDGMPTNVGVCPRCHGTSVIDDPPVTAPASSRARPARGRASPGRRVRPARTAPSPVPRVTARG